MVKTVYIKNFFVLFLIALFSYSCNLYKPVTTGKVSGIKLDKLSKESLRIKILIPVENPNSYKIKIKDYNFDLSLNNYKLGKASSYSKTSIAKKSNKIVEFPVEIKFNGNLFSGVMALLSAFSKGKIKINAKGEIKVRALIVNKKIKINENNSVKILK